MKTKNYACYIVLIPVKYPRESAEIIHNNNFDSISHCRNYLEGIFGEQKDNNWMLLEIFDFMDMFNDSKINDESWFISYVNIEQ